MKKLLTVVSLSVIALFLFGIVSAYAQEPGNPPQPFGRHMRGHGMMGGRGMGMMGGFGGMRFEAAAEALGLEEDALIEALQSGKTLPEIAEEQGVELADLEAALIADSEAHMALMVEDGSMTQEQADAMLETMRANISAHIGFMFSGMGNGMGFGSDHYPWH